MMQLDATNGATHFTNALRDRFVIRFMHANDTR
jgi:hypothetical protein